MQVQGGELKPKWTREVIGDRGLCTLSPPPQYELIIPNNLHSTRGIIAKHDELDPYDLEDFTVTP